MRKRIAKMAYKMFLRPKLKQMIKDSSNKWDDEMLKILDKIVKEW